QGIGLIIYRADSLEAARALADGDPMHKTGARSYILRRWMINEGSLTLSVGLSTGGAALS
ncbi:MAG: YciI family protein, partial [Pseudomonadota bacterium]